MLFDTDVIIWALRGNERAADEIDASENREVSIISYMEVVQGARDKAELQRIKQSLAALDFRVVPLTENIGHRALIYVEEYSLKGGMTMADALIAATAAEQHLDLCTGNRKHFEQVHEIVIRQFVPGRRGR